MLDTDAVQAIRVLFDGTPCWEDPPRVLAVVEEDLVTAIRQWWTDTFGEAPEPAFRNARIPLPQPSPTLVGTTIQQRVHGRTQTEPADVVLVDPRHPEVADFWREFSDARVEVLESQQ